jgi:preprotein translocase subunit SecF
MRFFANANYDFLGMRRQARMGSIAVLALGLAFALFWQFGRDSWLNYGVDFTGGTLVQVRFQQPTSTEELREVIAPVAPGAGISRFGGENEYLIRASQFQAAEGEETAAVIAAALQERFPGQYSIVRTEAVGPKIGEELQRRALLALLMAFGLALIYLAFRFEWRFGVAALVATFHDILIVLGFISAFRLDVSLPTVAAVLTIIGYSLNDTIVVFDRVRENLKRTGRRDDFIGILNRSINEVLPRTVVTSGTTLAALLALYLLGGAIIRDFAMILILGILVGTYSSIFIASPALLEINRRWPYKGKKKTVSGRARPARPGPAGATRAGV